MLASPHENYFNSLHSRYVYWFYRKKIMQHGYIKKRNKTKQKQQNKKKHINEDKTSNCDCKAK